MFRVLGFRAFSVLDYKAKVMSCSSTKAKEDLLIKGCTLSLRRLPNVCNIASYKSLNSLNERH